MKILLDMHIFLWFISGDSWLSADIRDAVRNSDNAVYLKTPRLLLFFPFLPDSHDIHIAQATDF